MPNVEVAVALVLVFGLASGPVRASRNVVDQRLREWLITNGARGIEDLVFHAVLLAD